MEGHNNQTDGPQGDIVIRQTDEGELEEEATCRNFRQVRQEGSRMVERDIPHYNLDMIISLGYRVKSSIATHFRRWATARLKEYIVKGFTMDDDRLKNLGGGNYWKELLDRIRDIRSSEKVFYRQVLDLYATSADYDPHSAESIAFFKLVQNKLHFAAHGHTAAEVVFSRADADKPFMGLQTFSGDFPTRQDIGIAKNYLTQEELGILNRLISGYFDFAEVQAMQHHPMFMHDYVEHLDRILASTGQAVLEDAGRVSPRGGAVRHCRLHRCQCGGNLLHERWHRKQQLGTQASVVESAWGC